MPEENLPGEHIAINHTTPESMNLHPRKGKINDRLVLLCNQPNVSEYIKAQYDLSTQEFIALMLSEFDQVLLTLPEAYELDIFSRLNEKGQKPFSGQLWFGFYIVSGDIYNQITQRCQIATGGETGTEEELSVLQKRISIYSDETLHAGHYSIFLDKEQVEDLTFNFGIVMGISLASRAEKEKASGEASRLVPRPLRRSDGAQYDISGSLIEFTESFVKRLTRMGEQAIVITSLPSESGKKLFERCKFTPLSSEVFSGKFYSGTRAYKLGETANYTRYSDGLMKFLS